MSFTRCGRVLPLLLLACPSPILTSPFLLYIHGAFYTLLLPPRGPTHTHTHTLTHSMVEMGAMCCLCSDGTLLHASLPHKFALINSRRSHMLTNRSFWGYVCVCVLEDVPVRSDTAITNLQISSFFFSSFFKEEQE